ncbi:MAG: deaminase [Candidatus Woesearchaeota archaeon]|jgi:deoxycytidylate deaminase
MRFLTGEEEKRAKKWFDYAANIAKNAKCLKKKCGSIIVKNNEVIGVGYNAPPLDNVVLECIKESLPKDFKSEKHCCLHAEQNAIIDALFNYSKKIQGSTLYYTKVDKNNIIQFSGKPYCTICSKMALRVKISEFAVWHKEGICVYGTDEYNKLSFEYRKT